jgi:hypothetical protein
MKKNKKQRAYSILSSVQKMVEKINNGSVVITRKYSAK